MITFLSCIALLLLSYFVYSKYIAKILGVNPSSPTPVTRLEDGVDFVPLSPWRLFLIQFLNIAGLGPIFGAILGATFGPVAFLWITFGTIFVGAVHDLASGVLSLKNDGANYPDIIGKYLGGWAKIIIRILTLALMVMVGAVFLAGPAGLLASLTSMNMAWWVAIIIGYYFIAAMMPIDKIIGKIYPLFAIAILVMTILLLFGMFTGGYQMVELNAETFTNMKAGAENTPIFPMMFITIACGAISGFHATQSPMVARCMKNEKQARPVFFGAMVAEAIVAMIWAAVAMAFFGGVESLNTELAAHGNNAAWAVNAMSNKMLGKVGLVLVTLGVIAAPITTGDTALRVSRLIAAEFLKIPQIKIKSRLLISIPIFATAFIISQLNFGIIWNYFAWLNQILAVFMLWTVSVYLYNNHKPYLITMLPAMFMTMVVMMYILYSKDLGAGLNYNISLAIATAITIAITTLFFFKIVKKQK